MAPESAWSSGVDTVLRDASGVEELIISLLIAGALNSTDAPNCAADCLDMNGRNAEFALGITTLPA